MKRKKLFITLFIACVAVFLSGCGRSAGSEGVHGENGVHGPDGGQGESPAGADIQVGDEARNVIVIENSGRLITRSYDFAGFDEVEASMFDLDIQQGEAYAVAIEVEENALDYVRVTVEGDRLELGLAPDKAYNTVNIPLRAQIAMPKVTAVVLDLGSDSTATGFDCGDGLRKELNLGSSLTCNPGIEQVRFEAEY